MRRNLIAALFLFLGVQTNAWAAGEAYLDSENGFRVTVPDGWTKASSSQGRVDIVLQSPRFETTRGVCPLSADPAPQTESMTQEQLNKEFESQFGEAFWRSMFAGAGLSVEVDEARSEIRGGRRVFLASLRLTGNVDGTPKAARVRVALHPTPGRMAIATCLAWLEHEAVEEADIATVLASFEPAKVEVIAAAPAVTLLAGPNSVMGLAAAGVAAHVSETKAALSARRR